LWLEQNPHLWPGTTLGLSEEHLKAEIRYGLLSGFPRSACEMYVKEISKNLEYKNPLQSILRFFTTKSNDSRIKRLDNNKVREISYKAGLWYVHYT